MTRERTGSAESVSRRLREGLAAAGLPAAACAAVADRWDRWSAAAAEPERRAAEALVEAEDWDLLADAFGAALGAELPLRGGVLRAAAGPGPNRLNSVSLAAAAAGHAAHLAAANAAAPPSAAGVSAAPTAVVVAWDERRFAALADRTSRDLAGAAAAAYAARGFAVLSAPAEAGRALAEPELAALIRRSGAAGGLYVGAGTAPAGEGAATFFGPDGAPQVCAVLPGGGATGPPAAAAPQPQPVPAAQPAPAPAPGRDAWFEAAAAVARAPEARQLHVVFTPLGGVAGAAVGGVLARAGFRVTTVRAEAVQDGAFGAVPFRRPDPRQAAALAAATALAREVRADLVIACDAVGARIGAALLDERSGCRVLAEDEIVALVADHLLRDGGGRVLASVLTTPLLARIARAAGAAVETDLAPGFAAVGAALRAAAAPTAAAAGAPFLAVGDAGALTARADLPTADAAAAALLLAERAAVEKAAGGTLGAALMTLWRRHGYVATRRRTVGFAAPGGAGRVAALLDHLRREPPRRIADRAVAAVTDRPADGVILFDLERDARVVVAEGDAPAALDVHVFVAAAPVPADADDLVLVRALGETDGQAGGLLEAFVLQALAPLDLTLPRAAFAIPDAVGVDVVAHFFGALVPQLEVGAQEVIARYATDAEVRAWVRAALEAYGPDAAALLRPGLDAHLSGLRAVAGERSRATLDLIRTLFG